MKKLPFIEEIFNYTILNMKFIKKHNIFPNINNEIFKSKNLSKNDILYIKKHILYSSSEFKLWVINPILKILQNYINYYKISYSFKEIKSIIYASAQLWLAKYFNLPDNIKISRIKKVPNKISLKKEINNFINIIKSLDLVNIESSNIIQNINLLEKIKEGPYREIIFNKIIENNKNIKYLYNKIINAIFSEKNISSFYKYFIVKNYIIKKIFNK